jgi:hypothetical protein
LSALERVLERLDGIKRRNGYVMARCPAHDDRHASLSIRKTPDGKVLLKDHGGCAVEEVLEAAGLTWQDLYSKNGHGARHAPTPHTSWEIRNATGQLVAAHHRMDKGAEGKQVWWRGPNGERTLSEIGLGTADLPLYRSEYAQDWPEDVSVIVTEGEPAADALAAVYPATLATVTGASKIPGPEALEVLRGKRVVLWADNDEEGRAHMRRVAEALQGVATEVRIFEWEGAPPKGDAADHPAVLSRSKKKFGELLDAMATAPFYSSATRDGVANERILRFKTAKELAEETPAVTEWIARPWVAKGAITEVDGKIKAGGKTTWVTYMARKILDGEPFMGESTARTKAVFLTEQPPTSFRKALERADLLEREDLLILHWHDTRGVSWPDVARAAVEKAAEVGAGILFVDTLGQFAGIRGDGENNAGAAQEAMRPLQEAAARGLAVVLTRHERKGGGEIGESGRGSSAFGGAVDVILSIRRGEGNTRPSVRIIESLSRFDETPSKLVIELTEGGYRSLGDATAFAEKEAMKAIVELLPSKEENALPSADILDKLKEQEIKRTVASEALAKLAASSTVRQIGAGKKGSPYRYYKPTPEEVKGSFGTPGIAEG